MRGILLLALGAGLIWVGLSTAPRSGASDGSQAGENRGHELDDPDTSHGGGEGLVGPARPAFSTELDDLPSEAPGAGVIESPSAAELGTEGAPLMVGERSQDQVLEAAPAVDPNLDQLNDETIVLNLFEGVTFVAARDRVDSGLGGSSIWVGHLHGVPQSQVILVDLDGDLSGTIKWPGNIYAVRPLGGGNHAIDQIDPELLLPLAQPLLRQAPGLSSGEEQADGGGTSEESLPSSQALAV